MEVYLNGRFVPYEQALVHVEDRGYVFADGIYEVIRFYGGKPLEGPGHFARLARSAAGIRLTLPPAAELTAAALETVSRNDAGDGALYLQVTRGVAPRKHPFPENTAPAVYMIARPVSRPAPDMVERGVACITIPDIRWQRCNIKSIALLPNVLAKQQAAEAGAYEAIFARDGAATEGSSSNVFAVRRGELWTHPESERILSGITRDVVLRLARHSGVPVREEPVPAAELAAADEIFITSTINEVMPVTRLDGRMVGDGRPGSVTMRLWEAFGRLVQELTA